MLGKCFFFFFFFTVISVNRRLFRCFGSYSGISVIPVILVNRRTRPGPLEPLAPETHI